MGYFHPSITYNDAQPDHSNAFIEYFGDLVHGSNQQFLAAVTGMPGKGKSWLCGAIAERYTKLYNVRYNIKKHIFWDLDSFVDLWDKHFKGEDEDVTYGTILQFEEPQTSANSRAWQSDANQVLNIITSTGRDRRFVVLFSCPSLNFIDKQSRILMNAEIKVDGFDKTTGITRCTPRFLEYVEKVDDFYKKRLLIKYPEPVRKGLASYYLQQWEVPRPSKEWIDQYEPMKKAYGIAQAQELKDRRDKKSTKGKLFLKVADLFAVHGQNYPLIIKETGIDPFLLRQYLVMLKKPTS